MWDLVGNTEDNICKACQNEFHMRHARFQDYWTLGQEKNMNIAAGRVR